MHVGLSKIISDISDVDECLSAKVNVFAVNELGNNCIHMAAGNGHVELIKHITENNIIVNESSDEDTKKRNLIMLINTQNKYLNTPLHWAVLNHQVEIVKLLLDLGVDASLRNIDHQTALTLAVSAEQEDLVELLAPRTSSFDEEIEDTDRSIE